MAAPWDDCPMGTAWVNTLPDDILRKALDELMIDHDPNDTIPNLKLKLKAELILHRTEQAAKVEEARKLRLMTETLGQVLNTTLLGRPDKVNHGSGLKKWGLQFNGLPTESVDVFLRSVENYASRHNIIDKDTLVSIMPEVMMGQARDWFIRTIKDNDSWDSFSTSLRERYRAQDYQSRLVKDIMVRTQAIKEPVADYIQNISDMNDSLTLDYKFTPVALMEIVKNNLNPYFQNHMAGTHFQSLLDLVEWGRTLEASYSRAKSYKPPPPPTAMVEPYYGYHGHIEEPKNRKQETQVYETQPTSPRRGAAAQPPQSEPPPQYREYRGSRPRNQTHATVKCWNCQQHGHRYTQCTSPLGKFCHRCGRQGVETYTCSCARRNFSFQGNQ